MARYARSSRSSRRTSRVSYATSTSSWPRQEPTSNARSGPPSPAFPYAETVSYGTIAKRIGRPAASRAVGAANGSNPLPIVVPCHRVIGSNGNLTGYGGGLHIKEALLALENRHGGQGGLFG